MNENKYVDILKKLVDKAIKSNEVPIAAIIVKNDKVIAKAYNKREKMKSVSSHAEILALNKAAKKTGDWRLDGCIMFTTLKPCKMCESAIKQSRIKDTYYLLNNEKEIVDKLILHKINDKYEHLYKEQLNSFFKAKR